MKESLKIFGAGFAIALVLISGTIWINVRHSAPGAAEKIQIPSWMRGAHTFFGGAIAGAMTQVCCLLVAVRFHFRKIQKRTHIILLSISWIGLVGISLGIWAFGTWVAVASWYV